MKKKSSKAWKFRQCPSCESEFPAGELINLTMGANYDPDHPAVRRCPKCGHEDTTDNFVVTRDDHLAKKRESEIDTLLAFMKIGKKK